jgi:hypothetical protein
MVLGTAFRSIGLGIFAVALATAGCGSSTPPAGSNGQGNDQSQASQSSAGSGSAAHQNLVFSGDHSFNVTTVSSAAMGSAALTAGGAVSCDVKFTNGGKSWNFTLSTAASTPKVYNDGLAGLTTEDGTIRYQATQAKVTITSATAKDVKGTVDADLGPNDPDNTGGSGDEKVSGSFECTL